MMAADPDSLYHAIPLSPYLAHAASAIHEAAGFAEHWSSHAFRDLLAMPGVGGRMALVEDDGPARGLILWRAVADEAEILTLCVVPACRRRGAGRFLLETALAALREIGVGRLCLEAAIDNSAAIALYRGSGFRAEGRRPRYYQTSQGPVDAVILVRHDAEPHSPAP